MDVERKSNNRKAAKKIKTKTSAISKNDSSIKEKVNISIGEKSVRGDSTPAPQHATKRSSKVSANRRRSWLSSVPNGDEEIENDRRDLASRKIQRTYRIWRKRSALHEKLKHSYVKIFDKDINEYLYKNKVTGQVYSKKPKFLGNEDLPSPRQYIAPSDYEPGEVKDEGYALLITSTSFTSERIKNIPLATKSDHEVIEHLLTHNFICRLKPENVFTLLDPTCAAFKDIFQKLSRICDKTGYLVVYISTHIFTIPKGDSRGIGRKRENSYICMKDTSWKSAKNSAATSISLTKFIDMLESIPCARKTLLISTAFLPRPERSYFKTKYLYPPQDFYPRLATLGNCAVIGSCNIGTLVPDMVRLCPRPASLLRPVPTHLLYRFRDILKSRNTIFPTGYDKLSMSRILFGGGRRSDDNELGNFNANDTMDDTSQQSQLPVELTTAITDTDSNDHYPNNNNSNSSSHNKIQLFERDYIQRLYNDWGLPVDISLVFQKTKYPEEPKPTFTRNTVTGKVTASMPPRSEERAFYSKLVGWAARRSVGPTVNLARRVAHSVSAADDRSPSQCSLVAQDSEHTVFGQAIAEALQGGASSHSSPYVTAQALYACVKKSMESRLQSQGLMHAQTPVLLVPANTVDVYLHPVCLGCGPPPSPRAPSIDSVGRSHVELHWLDPPFEGLKAVKYRLSMRLESRNHNTHWLPIAFKGTITERKFTVHQLPSGIRVKFRVEACNAGGWSKPSPASDSVCPGEAFIPLPGDVRWRKLVLGGPLAVLDRLSSYPTHRNELVTGFQKLICFAQKLNGFQRENIQLKTVSVSLSSLETFPEDAELGALALLLIGYCTSGGEHKQKVKDFCLQRGLPDKVKDLIGQFRYDTRILGAIAYLRQMLPRDIPEVPRAAQIVEREGESDDDDDELVKGDELDVLAQIRATTRDSVAGT